MARSTRKLSLALLATLSLITAESSFAAYAMPQPAPSPLALGNWYVTGFGGPTYTPNINTQPLGLGLSYESVGYDFGLSVGYRGGPMRFEGQYTYMRTTHNKLAGIKNGGSTTVQAGMGNAFYDFQQVSDRFTPYLGVGVGYAHVKSTALVTSSTTDNVFAYQGMIGVYFEADNNFDVDIGYRYFATSKPSNVFSEDYQNNLLNLTIRYHIPV